MTHILELIRKNDEEINLYDNRVTEFTEDPKAISSKNFVDKEYIRDFFFRDLSTK